MTAAAVRPPVLGLPTGSSVELSAQEVDELVRYGQLPHELLEAFDGLAHHLGEPLPRLARILVESSCHDYSPIDPVSTQPRPLTRHTTFGPQATSHPRRVIGGALIGGLLLPDRRGAPAPA